MSTGFWAGLLVGTALSMMLVSLVLSRLSGWMDEVRNELARIETELIDARKTDT